MADTKISAQTDGTRLSVNDEIPVSRAGVAYRAKAVESGTFTPTIAFGGAAVGVTYTTQIGRWQRIANRVFFNIFIVLSAKGSSTGSLTVGTLPVAAEATASNFQALAVRPAVLSSISGAVVANVSPGGTTIAVHQTTTGTTSALTEVNLNNTSQLMISGSYEV